MGATTSYLDEYGAGAQMWYLGRGRVGESPPTTILYQVGSRNRETFIDAVSAEIDLRADRSGLIKRVGIMGHIPDRIKWRIMHPSPESQVRGFEDLFF